MKILKYIIIFLTLIFSIYCYSNWAFWNITFDGYLFGLLLLLLFSIYSSIIIIKGLKKTVFISIIMLIMTNSFVYLLFDWSVKYGNIQAKHYLLEAKNEIDKYYTVNGYFPDETFIQNLNKPIFLWLNGIYFLDLDENHNFFTLSIEAKGGDYGLSIYRNNKIESYDY